MGKNSGWSLTLKPGMKGIFVTCAMKREDSCMKEAIDLFQEVSGLVGIDIIVSKSYYLK